MDTHFYVWIHFQRAEAFHLMNNPYWNYKIWQIHFRETFQKNVFENEKRIKFSLCCVINWIRSITFESFNFMYTKKKCFFFFWKNEENCKWRTKETNAFWISHNASEINLPLQKTIHLKWEFFRAFFHQKILFHFTRENLLKKKLFFVY